MLLVDSASFAVLIFALQLSQCFGNHDDIRCNSELIQFDNALVQRELWALKCESNFEFKTFCS